MRSLLILILAVTFFSSYARSQDDDLGTATSALQDVLGNLKESVQKLSLDNDQLTARDNAMKDQVSQLQLQLGNLQAQGGQLDNSVASLQGNDPGRSRVITALENENYDLDNRIQKDEVAIKSIQESLGPGFEEDQRLLLQLKGMNNSLFNAPRPLALPSKAEDRLQVEKLKLMKMIYESQQRQESLHEAILKQQKDSPLMPAADALARQQALKDQIKDLQAGLAMAPADKPLSDAGFSWDDSQLLQLEDELKVLERNYIQLKALMEQMDKKHHGVKVTASQLAEGEKLKGNLMDMERQGVGLRAQLDDLRAQMVDLDKRKSHLEEMIKQLPG